MSKETNVSAMPAATPKRAHKATYATDKRKGGYIIRVEGPNAHLFVGRTVPVTTKSGEEHEETLLRVLWGGKDKETGAKVALYDFENKPRDLDDIPF